MNCPNCNTLNDNDNVFCVNCGVTVTKNISGQENIPPTVQMPFTGSFPPNHNAANSVETSVLPVNQFQPSMSNYNSSIAYTGGGQTAKSGKIFVWIGAAVVLILLAAGGGIYFLTRPNVKAETLPEHLGMFVQNKEKDRVDEIKRQNVTNALEGKTNLLKDDTLPVLDETPNWILYSDNQDVPLGDLRLIQLDTIKDDGSLKQMDFQAAPVEGKPEMKRIRVADGLANGKYAFALFDGYLNEGKHKLWAFQIKNAAKSDNGDALKATKIEIKPKSAPDSSQPQKMPSASNTVPNNPPPSAPPPGTLRVAYSKKNRLILRGGPSQYSSDQGVRLRINQMVYVMGYSNEYEYFQGTRSNFAFVQTEKGQTGWVFAAYLR